MTPTWLDKAVGFIAPQRGLKRIRARVAADLLIRHYEAASTGRRTQGWRRTSGDANADVAPSLTRLRELARDHVRNNPHADNALDTIANQTVGDGIMAKPFPFGKAAAETWKAWACTTACDADGRHDFYGLQKLVMRSVAESGEVLVRRRFRLPSDGLPLPFQIQLLEPDYLDTNKSGIQLPNKGRIVHGVEFDALGRRAAYWLFKEHPGAQTGITATGAGASVRVPAEDILHVFHQERVGQVRAATWFASSLLKSKDFDEYDDAQLMKQKIAACLAVLTSDVDGTGAPLGTVDDTTAQPQIDSLEPGMIMNVPPGRSISVVDPPSVAEFKDYASVTLHAIAVGIGLTNEDFTGDYCMAPETRVLRGDLRWVRADELREGDPIVAFDENKPTGRGQRRKWRKASVVRAGRRDLSRVRIVTDKTSVTVSNEHAFLCVGTQGVRWSPKVGYGHVWVRADQLKPGDRIAFLSEPWQEGNSYQHGYLKGIADGEGYVNRKQARIGIAQKPGAVFDEIGVALNALNFSPRQHGKPNGSGTLSWDVFGTANCLRFLGEVRPTRLLQYADEIYDDVAMSGGMGKKGQQCHATVLSTEIEGVGPVVTLETTTHTVITEGLCSHNTNLPFSAARMSRIAHQSRLTDWRWRTLIPQFCQPVWGWAMEAALIMGQVREPAPSATWTAPAVPFIDPSAEGLAFQRNIRGGLQTWSESVRERGYDPDEVLIEMASDNQKFDDLGIILDSDPRKTTQAGLPRDSQQPQAAPQPQEQP